MGAALVGAALNPHWTRQLTDTDRIVLIAMALTARDTPTKDRPAAVYWGGHEYLILALTGEVPDRGPDYELREQRVKRAVRSLVKAGAIERLSEGRRGHRAEYRLTLASFNQPSLPVDNVRTLPTKGVTQRPPNSARHDPLSGS